MSETAKFITVKELIENLLSRLDPEAKICPAIYETDLFPEKKDHKKLWMYISIYK